MIEKGSKWEEQTWVAQYNPTHNPSTRAPCSGPPLPPARGRIPGKPQIVDIQKIEAGGSVKGRSAKYQLERRGWKEKEWTWLTSEELDGVGYVS